MPTVDSKNHLNQLASAVLALTPQERRELARRVDDLHVKQLGLDETVQELRRSLDDLRVTVAYTVFDLEATRRENELLRKELGREPRE